MSAGGDRRVVFALMGIAVLCLIGLGASLYRAKAGELTKLEQKLEQKQNQLAEAREKLTDLPALEATYAKVQARLQVLEPALPDSAYIPTFLRQIEGLATGTRNSILMIRPKTVAKKSSGGAKTTINDETGEIIKGKAEPGKVAPPRIPYDFVPIELQLVGTYWTVIDFLTKLREFPKMIAVNDIGFVPKQAGVGARQSLSLTATMGLTAVVTKGGNDGRSE